MITRDVVRNAFRLTCGLMFFLVPIAAGVMVIFWFAHMHFYFGIPIVLFAATLASYIALESMFGARAE